MDKAPVPWGWTPKPTLEPLSSHPHPIEMKSLLDFCEDVSWSVFVNTCIRNVSPFYRKLSKIKEGEDAFK